MIVKEIRWIVRNRLKWFWEDTKEEKKVKKEEKFKVVRRILKKNLRKNTRRGVINKRDRAKLMR